MIIFLNRIFFLFREKVIGITCAITLLFTDLGQTSDFDVVTLRTHISIQRHAVIFLNRIFFLFREKEIEITCAITFLFTGAFGQFGGGRLL